MRGATGSWDNAGPSVAVKTGCDENRTKHYCVLSTECWNPPLKARPSVGVAGSPAMLRSAREARSGFFHCPVMKPNLRHRRADFKTNPVTENDAGPHHLAGTRCKSHCAVSSRTIWQTNHQLDFNEKSGKWFIFCVSCQIFLNWLINVARLARTEIERRGSFAVEQHELATED